MDSLARLEVYFRVKPGDGHGLRRDAFDVDLNATNFFVVKSVVPKSSQVEIPAELSIYARQQIEIEGGS